LDLLPPVDAESLVALIPSLCEKRESSFRPLMQSHLVDSCRVVQVSASRAISGADGGEKTGSMPRGLVSFGPGVAYIFRVVIKIRNMHAVKKN
jgi:hypothetical protein